MTFKDIFEYCGLKNTFNVALLPPFVKGLLEIQRIESLRENNRTTKHIKITPLGNHGIWEAKRIILVGFDNTWLENNAKKVTVDNMDIEYDHIIAFENIPALSNAQAKNIESYIHIYLDKQKNETKRKQVNAPYGVRALVSNKYEVFVLKFIKAKLSKYQLYVLN